MTLDVRGGIDEELLSSLVADGVPRNQAVQIASIARGLSQNQIFFLGSLTTDASGRFILNTFPQDIPLRGGEQAPGGEGSTIEDAIAFVQTSQGQQFVEGLIEEQAEFETQVRQYEESFAQLQDVQGELADLEARDLSTLDAASRTIFEERITDKREQLTALGNETLDIVRLIAPEAITEGLDPSVLTVPQLTADQLRLTGLDQMQALFPTAPVQEAAGRATGAFVAPGGPTTRQRALLGALGQRQTAFQAEVEREKEEARLLGERRAVQQFAGAQRARLAAAPPQPTAFQREFGALPAGAGSPAFRSFVERAGPTLRQRVEAQPLEQQLPFLRRRFAAIGPQARGDFGTARFAPPARFLTRR